MIKNIMTVDLEDFYNDLPYSEWNQYNGRVEETTMIVLDLFEKYNARATFFTLGYIAQKHPGLIELVKSKGHEIASHSFSHPNVSKMTRQDFEMDLIKSLQILRRVSGERILGFRAPYFSLNKHSLWAFSILRKYFRYDSSFFPVRFHYGLHNAPRHIYRMSDENPLEQDDNGKLVEIPMATLTLPVIGNIPAAGGIYLRFLPYYILKKGIETFNRKGLPAVLYIHPKDLDPKMPRIRTIPWYSYWGLDRATKKFESILRSFKFSPIREVISL
jgi:polysaccharide deacetylase family protein (PEP-CTERM system associated)